MKKLKKNSLQNLFQNKMSKKEQDVLKGGSCACSCTCSYRIEGSDDMYGGSAFFSNLDANDFLAIRP